MWASGHLPGGGALCRTRCRARGRNGSEPGRRVAAGRPGQPAALLCPFPCVTRQRLCQAAALVAKDAPGLGAPEGCWAWVVLLASVVTQGLTLWASPRDIGIFFTELQREFQASNSETSWFPSILTAMPTQGVSSGWEGPWAGVWGGMRRSSGGRE